VSHASPDLGAVAGRSVGAYLGIEGFELLTAEPTKVEYAKSGMLLSLSYYAEEAAPRGLNIGLGFRHQDGTTNTVGLWSLIPEDAMGESLALVRFTDEDELLTLLLRLRDVALPRFAARYWRQPDLLVSAVQRAAADREAMHQRAIDQKQLEVARKAFDKGDFQRAVDLFALAGDELSAADTQRLNIARREAGRNH
jgi:hypothetical protein